MSTTDFWDGEADSGPVEESRWQPARPRVRANSTGSRTDSRTDSATDSGTDSGTGSAAPAGPTAPARVTHRIVKPGGGLVDLAKADSDQLAADDQQDRPTARERALDGLSLFRFFGESPGSLRDQIEFAEEGAYTTGSPDGWWRTLNIWYARSIAFVGLSFCYLIAWAFFTRLTRAATSTIVGLCVLWALNQLPVTAWLIPDGLDFTTWPAAIAHWFAPDDLGGCWTSGTGE